MIGIKLSFRVTDRSKKPVNLKFCQSEWLLLNDVLETSCQQLFCSLRKERDCRITGECRSRGKMGGGKFRVLMVKGISFFFLKGPMEEEREKEKKREKSMSCEMKA